MRKLLLTLCLVASILPTTLAAPARATHQPQAGCREASQKIQGYITVAEGTEDEAQLHYQVLLPNQDLFGSGPYATVLDYSGYKPGITFYDGVHRHFLCEGYAVAGVNIRGTGCSSGSFDYFEPRQAEDGREAIDFLTKQEWSNGRLAMVGKSYPGITQLFVAGQPLQSSDWRNPTEDPKTPEGLVAIVPGHVFGDLYRDVPYPGGIMNVTFAAGWSAGRVYEPFSDPYYEHQLSKQKFDQQCSENALDHVQNPPQNPFVKAVYNQYDSENVLGDDLFGQRSPWYWAKNIDVPTLLVESWQDEQVGSRATALTERFAPDLDWKMIATNGDHWDYYGSHVLPFIDEFLRFHLAQEIPPSYQGGTVTETTFVPKHENPNAARKDEEKDKGTTVTTERPETFDEALARYTADWRVQLHWETGGGGAPVIANPYPEPQSTISRKPTWIQRYGSWPPANQSAWRLNMTPDGQLIEGQAAAGEVSYAYAPGVGSQQRGGYKLTDRIPTVPGVQPASWSEGPPQGTYAVFETPELDTDKILAGPASIDLTVASTSVDTDFEVTITEVRPDGQEVFVQQGWLRASHRKEDPALSTPLRPFQTHEEADADLLVPGAPAKVRIEVFPFGHPFRQGSKIRVYVAAPHVKPDLWGFALLPTPAVNTIYTGPGMSSVALPLLEGDSALAPMPPCTLINQPCRPVWNG